MDIIQIYTLVTGILYIVLEIRQKNLMWAVGVLTSVGAMYVFFQKGAYASFGLNTYYLIMSFWGIYQWRKAKTRASEISSETGQEGLHLNRMGWKTAVTSAVIVLAGTWGLVELMDFLKEAGMQENPMSHLDASVTMLSAVATWWLARSYIQQWWLWIAADFMTALMCAGHQAWPMVILYGAYSLSAIYGYVYWKRHGIYLD